MMCPGLSYPQAVRRARQEEIEYVKKMRLYDKVPISECRRNTGKGPISVRWIDINKGDQVNPNYRSRIVAREINTHKREDLFAAIPPLEALKIIFSFAASGNKGELLMINDISRAFFHAPAKRQVYVQLPQEDQMPGEEGMCGRLNYSMYGTRDAAQNWFDQYSGHLKKIGFQQGKASPCTFYHADKGIRTYVHGDDYVSVGKPESLKWLRTALENSYTVKTQVLGPGPEDLKEVKILNRIVAWDQAKGLSYEAKAPASVATRCDFLRSGKVTSSHLTLIAAHHPTFFFQPFILYSVYVRQCHYFPLSKF